LGLVTTARAVDSFLHSSVVTLFHLRYTGEDESALCIEQNQRILLYQ
jgi:hypothetical protein